MTVTLVAKVTYLPTAQGHDNFEHPCVTPLDLVTHQKRGMLSGDFPGADGASNDDGIHKHRKTLGKKCDADVPSEYLTIQKPTEYDITSVLLVIWVHGQYINRHREYDRPYLLGDHR